MHNNCLCFDAVQPAFIFHLLWDVHNWFCLHAFKEATYQNESKGLEVNHSFCIYGVIIDPMKRIYGNMSWMSKSLFSPFPCIRTLSLCFYKAMNILKANSSWERKLFYKLADMLTCTLLQGSKWFAMWNYQAHHL